MLFVEIECKKKFYAFHELILIEFSSKIQTT